MRSSIKFFLMGSLLVNAVCYAEGASQGRCGLVQLTSVQFTVVDGLVWVPVLINGVPVRLLLDIGNAVSGMDADAAASLKIRTKQWPTTVANFRVNSEVVRSIAVADSMSIGRLKFGKVEFLVAHYPQIGGAMRDAVPVVGTLGISFFANVDFELDFTNSTLNLYSQDHCPGKVVYWANSYSAVPIRKGELGEPYFLMELEGKKLQTSLSTGTDTTVLYTDASKKLFGFDEKSPDVVTDTDASNRNENYYRAMSLTAEGLAITNTKIKLVKLDRSTLTSCTIKKEIGKDRVAGYSGSPDDFCYGVYPLKLGMNVLQKLHIYFATKEKMMYFTAAATNKQLPDPSP